MLAAVIAPLFGLLADRLGIAYAFAVGGIVLLAASPFLMLGRNKQQPDPEPDLA